MGIHYEIGMKVRIRPERPFAKREAMIRAVTPTRLTLYILPNGPEVQTLVRDVEVEEGSPVHAMT